MKRTSVALATVALLTFAGCGSPAEPGDAGAAPVTSTTIDPETPVSSSPGDPDGGTGDGGPRFVEPKPGQADVHPLRWQKIRVGDDDRTLRIHFTSGIEPCYVLDHIDVETSPDKVVVTLYEGHSPTDEDVACIEIAEYKVTEVTLDGPLNGRKLVDGAE